jgi:hypothetical protein
LIGESVPQRLLKPRPFKTDPKQKRIHNEDFSLSPRWGWIIPYLYPRLTPWAAFFRRFAARNRCRCFTLNLQSDLTRALEAAPFQTDPIKKMDPIKTDLQSVFSASCYYKDSDLCSLA